MPRGMPEAMKIRMGVNIGPPLKSRMMVRMRVQTTTGDEDVENDNEDEKDDGDGARLKRSETVVG